MTAAAQPTDAQPTPTVIPPKDFLQPDTAPGDVPDFAEEFTTSGVEKSFWNKPKIEPEKNTRELLI